MRDAKPKVLLVVTELSMGGAARVVRDHAAAFAEHFDVREVVFNTDDGVDFPGEERPLSLDVGGGGGPLAKLANLGRRVRRLSRIKQQFGPEVSISHLEGAHYVDLLSRGSEKIILCVHGSILGNRDIRGAKGWLRRRVLIPTLYRRADRIVTVSRDIVPELVAIGVEPARIRTINNFFDVAEIASKAAEPLPVEERAIFAGAPVLVTSGRFAEQKNQAPLLAIFAELVRSRPAKLVMLGDGPLRDDLVAQAEQLGLRTYRAWDGGPPNADCDLYFLGNRANPFPYLKHAALFVLPSSWEGFPLALGEAMACGLPVVSTDCPTGPREILAPDSSAPNRPIRAAENAPYGVLMPMLDRKDRAIQDRAVWVENLARLLDDPAERARLAAAGAQRVMDFAPDRIVPQWLDLIGELIEPERTSSYKRT